MIGLMLAAAAASATPACPPSSTCSLIPPPRPAPSPPTDPVQLALLRARVCVEDTTAQIGAFSAVEKLSAAADKKALMEAGAAVSRFMARRQEQKQCVMTLVALGRDRTLTDEERSNISRAAREFSVTWYANAFATDAVTFKLLNPGSTMSTDPPLPFPPVQP